MGGADKSGDVSRENREMEVERGVRWHKDL